jgi:hypothetical protein
MIMDPNQLEDADRRGVNPYAEIQARGRANDPGPGAIFRAGDDTRMAWADRPVDDGPDEFPPPRFSPFPAPAPLPVEPAPGSVIGFVKDFGMAGSWLASQPSRSNVSNGKLYTYVAVHADNEVWYLSGPQRGGRSFTWADLLEFIGGPEQWATVGIVAAWDRLVP